MKLYVCHTIKGPDIHPCAKAYRALTAHGYDPVIELVSGSARLPRIFDFIAKTKGRHKVERLTGETRVPALEFDNGKAIAGSTNISKWCEQSVKNG